VASGTGVVRRLTLTDSVPLPSREKAALHRLRHRGGLGDRFGARRRLHRDARMAHLGPVRQRLQHCIRAGALPRPLEGTGNAGIVGFAGGGEIDIGHDALRRPGRHNIAHFPEQPGRQEKPYAEDDGFGGRTRQRFSPDESLAVTAMIAQFWGDAAAAGRER
jgi:hypothetical protein